MPTVSTPSRSRRAPAAKSPRSCSRSSSRPRRAPRREDDAQRARHARRPAEATGFGGGWCARVCWEVRSFWSGDGNGLQYGGAATAFGRAALVLGPRAEVAPFRTARHLPRRERASRRGADFWNDISSPRVALASIPVSNACQSRKRGRPCVCRLRTPAVVATSGMPAYRIGPSLGPRVMIHRALASSYSRIVPWESHVKCGQAGGMAHFAHAMPMAAELCEIEHTLRLKLKEL
mmetsp:Transcript_66610/g.182682  ORF Transcript_66610/g.182682 Transcript_66610/m.182682 type:complete len:234 (+) Transcript_66610:1108-1809(+)